MTDILVEREKTHGDFRDTASVSQRFRDTIRSYGSLTATQEEALMMIALKIARILCGDAFFAEHWDDIIGYARLGRGDTVWTAEQQAALEARVALVAGRAPPTCPDIDQEYDLDHAPGRV